MGSKQGPPKHQNRFAWKPKAGVKINETEVGGKFRPYSEVTGVCPRCKDQIEWKRKYGKYKPLSEPAKCQRCSKRAVRQAYHNLCTVGRDSSEVEAEQKMLEETINNAREREKRTLLRAMNKGKSQASPAKTPSSNESKVGDLFKDASLDEYAENSREDDNGNDEGQILD